MRAVYIEPGDPECLINLNISGTLVFWNVLFELE